MSKDSSDCRCSTCLEFQEMYRNPKINCRCPNCIVVMKTFKTILEKSYDIPSHDDFGRNRQFIAIQIVSLFAVTKCYTTRLMLLIGFEINRRIIENYFVRYASSCARKALMLDVALENMEIVYHKNMPR